MDDRITTFDDLNYKEQFWKICIEIVLLLMWRLDYFVSQFE